MNENLIGQSLGRYQIEAELGEGGMGRVLKAHDPTLKRDVAIKVMHAQLARQPGFQERFLQEARTAAQLDHPNIVKVYDFCQAPPWLYIVMEFIPGSNLHEMLKEAVKDGKWIALSEAIELVRQVSVALDYAHRQGVLHRDIKPANIMLKNEPSDKLDYRPVVTDLGLAKLREGGLVTSEGVSMGTPAYVSPEQAQGGKTDVRSDVYSLGVLLYELAVARLPFPFKTITEAALYFAREESLSPPAPRSIRADLPEAVEGVILRALQKDPADRFADAKGLAEALAATLTDASVTSVLTAPDRSWEMGMKTALQQSLVKPRGTSILKDFPKTAPPLPGRDRIQVLSPDRTGRTVEIRAQTISIGRKGDNDLVLDDPKVSGHHARLAFDGTDYQVTDLDSTNGTYLANVKLLPGMAQKWTSDKPLGLGDHWLRLLRAQSVVQPGTSGISRLDGTMVDTGQIRSISGEGRVGAFMEVTQLTVEPGGSTTAALVILNQGTVVDHFQVSVQGIPAEWLPAPPPAVELMPGLSQEVRLSIQVPRAPHSQAGKHPLVVRVASQDAPDQVAEIMATLTVAAYSQFCSNLHPQKIPAGQTARVTVTNQGNAQETFSLAWRDRAAELAFEPPDVRVPVAAGQERAVDFRASPHQRPWLGGEKSYAFAVHVSSSKGEVQTHQGEVVSRALIPLWILPLFLCLCLALAAAAASGYYLNIFQPAQGTATAWAVGVATATQVAFTADTDGDGLTDVEEVKLGTNPNLADTDGDGLSDKEEVDWPTDPKNRDSDQDGLFDGDERKWGTNPHAVDSDGDTLQDGAEVHGWKRTELVFHTSPINKDTDGDGLLDNVDPDPGQLPTPTPIPTPTSTATSTPIPTPTPDLGATAQAAQDLTATAEAKKAQQAAAAATQTAIARQASANDEATQQAMDNPPIDIKVDQTAINAGECTTLRWDIQHVKAVYLNGGGVAGQGQQRVCPGATTTYTWRIVKQNGKETSVSQTVTVKASTICSAQLKGNGQEYTTVKDDSLGKLADKYLGNQSSYRAIIYYTNLKHAKDASYSEMNTDWDSGTKVPSGLHIYIPSQEEVAAYQKCQ